MTALVLRTNALLAAALGAFLLAATWNDLYAAFRLPHPEEAIFAQIGGAFALGLAYLLWVAPRNPHLTHAVAAGTALANGLAALLGSAWLVHDRFDVASTTGLLGFVAIEGLFALAEGWIASRSVAMPVPGG